MKLFEIRDSQGRVVAFEISNLFVSRRRVSRIVKSIPGARTTLSPRFFSWSQAVFCKFEIDGGNFLVEEPFGDNSRYWVGCDPPGWHPALLKVVAAFEDAAATGL
jgi:hypothetical protein